MREASFEKKGCFSRFGVAVARLCSSPIEGAGFRLLVAAGVANPWPGVLLEQQGVRSAVFIASATATLPQRLITASVYVRGRTAHACAALSVEPLCAAAALCAALQLHQMCRC